MGRKQNRGDLKAARDARQPVRLVRSVAGANYVEGLVLDVDRDWVLLHKLNDLRLDGWSAVRLDTVRKITGPGNGLATRRALKLHGERAQPVDADLSSTAKLVRSLARVAPLLALHYEESWPDECSIGRPVRLTKKAVHLLDVTPRATWDAESRRFTFRELTRIDFGGHYETTLHALAGEPPLS